METFIKDEAFVLSRRFVGNSDMVITIYGQKLGVETVFIQNGQLIKNLPYVYLDKFTYIKAVFQKYREERVYISEIYKVITFGLKVSESLESLFILTEISNMIYNYVLYPDKTIFNLYKKTLYYSIKTGQIHRYYVSFLVKFIYLLGVYDRKELDGYWDIFVSILNTPIREVKTLNIDRSVEEKLSAKLIENINRWLG